MNETNITAQQMLEANPGQPIAVSLRQAPPRCCRSISAPIAMQRKSERQNEASQPLVTDEARVTTPAVLQRNVHNSITAMPSLRSAALAAVTGRS